MANFDFFQHKQCEYFPCHKGVDPEKFSCLFCYCPLYALGRGSRIVLTACVLINGRITRT